MKGGVDLAGIALPEARTGGTVGLGDLGGVDVLTLICHRY